MQKKVLLISQDIIDNIPAVWGALRFNQDASFSIETLISWATTLSKHLDTNITTNTILIICVHIQCSLDLFQICFDIFQIISLIVYNKDIQQLHLPQQFVPILRIDKGSQRVFRLTYKLLIIIMPVLLEHYISNMIIIDMLVCEQ